jgi:sec-independent protein translocase protein TatB
MSTGPVVGLLDTVTFPELMTILVIGLVVLGPDKLPGMARSAGRWLNKLRAMTANLQDEVRGALDESEMESLRELGEFAVRPRAKLAEYARKAALDDGDDPTDGDAPAATAPVLPAIGVGADNPMVTHAPPASATSPDPLSPAVPAPAPDPAPAPVITPTGSGALPAHLAGTRLATGSTLGDPPAPPATDAPVMADTAIEPSADET